MVGNSLWDTLLVFDFAANTLVSKCLCFGNSGLH